MSLDIRPLLSALRRSPTGAILVALQVAITLAVLVNAAFLVSQRIAQIEQPTGLDTDNTFGIILGGVSNKFNVAQAESEDLAYLRSLPGVVAATVTVGIPLTGMGSWNTQLWRQPGQRGAPVATNMMNGDSRSLLSTLAVPLIAGRNFRADEILPLSPGKASPAEIILTRALAQALFPHGDALGKTVYDSASNPLTVLGIARNFMGAVGGGGDVPLYHAALLPITPGQSGFYALLVRTRPGRRDEILRIAQQHIGASHRNGVIGQTLTLAAAKDAFEADNRNKAVFLSVVTAFMLAVCCLGIFGLTTFNVGSRTRQIGTRRAVGARRRDIVTHFMVENALILTAGALLGSVLALAVGDWLTTYYGLPRLDLAYLLAGVIVLWVIGQLAAWQPARRAASVPPSVASRTV
jgi:putative ABC transport system permease protein